MERFYAALLDRDIDRRSFAKKMRTLNVLDETSEPATLSAESRKVVERYYDDTASCASRAGIDFALNDFGFRGTSAGLGDAAHLLSFRGSDTVEGFLFAQRYYNAKRIYGLSVPAPERSVCTLLGEEGELDVFRHVLQTFPTGLVSCVSDSYDIFRACSEYWGGALKKEVLARNGTLVIRPDSGDPVAPCCVCSAFFFKSLVLP